MKFEIEINEEHLHKKAQSIFQSECSRIIEYKVRQEAQSYVNDLFATHYGTTARKNMLAEIREKMAAKIETMADDFVNNDEQFREQAHAEIVKSMVRQVGRMRKEMTRAPK